MTQYVTCNDCGTSVPWYYAWIWHPVIAMHPGCALQRWDDEGAGAMGPILRSALQNYSSYADYMRDQLKL